MFYCVTATVMLFATATRAGADEPATQREPVTAGGEKIAIRGTHIRLARPAGFAVSDTNPGFVNEDTGERVVVIETPADAAEVIKGFTAAALKEQGVELKQRKELRVVGQNGLLMALVKVQEDVTSNNWMLVFGDARRTTMITASFMPEHSKQLSPLLKECLLSAEYIPDDQFDPLDGLPYAVTPPPSLKLAMRTAQVVIYNPDGKLPMPDVRTPRFTVAPSDRPIEIEDRKQFAEQLALRAFDVKNGKLQSIVPSHIDDLDGFASEVLAEKGEPGVPLYIYQVVLFVGDDKEQSFWILRGEGGVDSRKEFAADFEKMARSFRRQK